MHSFTFRWILLSADSSLLEYAVIITFGYALLRDHAVLLWFAAELLPKR